MRELQLDEIKQIELDLLAAFAEYCEKHGLRYFLYAGTLLGAVRHKGFIPWDDDIDVAMPRPDYNRFCDMVQKDPVAPHIGFMSPEVSENYTIPFAKLCDDRTDGSFSEVSFATHIGVWIDIFPLDGLPADKAERDAHVAALQDRIVKLKRCIRKFSFCANPIELAKRSLRHLLYSRYDYEELIRELNVLSQKYDYEKSPYIGVVVFSEGQNNVIPKEGFEETVLLPFEGRFFRAPAVYDDYLTRLYGDYMTPPPASKRVSDHSHRSWLRDGFEGALK